MFPPPPHKDSPTEGSSVKTTDVMAYAPAYAHDAWHRKTASSAWHRCIPPMNWKATAPRRGDAIILSFYIRESLEIYRSLTFGLLEELYVYTRAIDQPPPRRLVVLSFANPSTRSIIYVIFLLTQNSIISRLLSMSISSECGMKALGDFLTAHWN